MRRRRSGSAAASGPRTRRSATAPTTTSDGTVGRPQTQGAGGSSDVSILRVALPGPLRRLYDYLPPAGSDPQALRPGARIDVPFGRSRRCAILVELPAASALPPERLKRAYALLDPAPLLDGTPLALLRWAADYYQHPLGEVLLSGLPARLRDGSAPLRRPPEAWRLTAAGRALDGDALRRAPRQAALFELLQAHPEGVAHDQLRSCFEAPGPVLERLRAHGWIEPCAAPAPSAGAATGPALNDAQQAAVAAVSGSDGFAVFLLEGVTGSGKTEVYLRLAASALEAGRQVLVLVPEIGLTPQLVERFRRRLPAPCVTLHSGIADGEREAAWLAARDGRAAVVIGTRSAVLTPLARPGLIVVDEEHDLSYKQQEGFRYSARDLAVVRGRLDKIPVVLGSATPSLESLRNVETGRYRRLSLPARATGAAAPPVGLLDLRALPLEDGLSPPLIEAAGRQLAAGNQVLFFLNRRGYAPVLLCHACGATVDCPHCDARPTLHQRDNLLRCHHCGHVRRPPERCGACGAAELRRIGVGTERLEERLAARFPGVALLRIDRDTTRRKGALERRLAAVRAGEAQLLVGTQMLAKGHHFPEVTLVAILDVDQALFSADFRAPERLAQLIVQVAGRAGRARKPGRVLLQTHQPDHPLLQTLVRDGYAAFAAAALAERRAAELPPYAFQALLRAEAPRPERAERLLAQARVIALELGATPLEVWGPVAAPMARRAGQHRVQLLLQCGARARLQRLVAPLVARLEALPDARRLRWSLDVDPQELF